MTCPYGTAAPQPYSIFALAFPEDDAPPTTIEFPLDVELTLTQSDLPALTQSGFTISAWLAQDLGNNGCLLSKSDVNGLLWSLCSSYQSSLIAFSFRSSDGSIAVYQFPTEVTPDNFLHAVSIVFIHNALILYYDGALVISSQTVGIYATETLPTVVSIGNGFSGSIRALDFYDVALSHFDVQSYANLAQTASPAIQPECRCPSTFPLVYEYDDTMCADRIDPSSNNLIRRVNPTSFPASAANDDSASSRWQSANFELSTLEIDLLGLFELYSINITFVSDRPGAMAIDNSNDGGNTWTTLKYYATDCVSFFSMPNNGQITSFGQVNCATTSSIQSPGLVAYTLFNINDTPEAYGDAALQQSLTTHIRIRLLHFFVTQVSSTALYDGFFAVSDISAFGRVACNGHANSIIVNPQTEISTCNCLGNTVADYCTSCDLLFNDALYARGNDTFDNSCLACDCNNHADSCEYDSAIQTGRCIDCADNTTGVHCEKCNSWFYRPVNVPVSDPTPCQPCQCSLSGSTQCAADKFAFSGAIPGQCVCKQNVQGTNCDQCAAGYFSLAASNPQGCTACNCNSNGTIPNGICDSVTGNCPCGANVIGTNCDQCAPGYYGLSTLGSCSPCKCATEFTVDGSNTCDAIGQCTCIPGSTGVHCDKCHPGYYNGGVTSCQDCGCSAIGSASTSCDNFGNCTCLTGYVGTTCDTCAPSYTVSVLTQICQTTTADIVFLLDMDAIIGQSNFNLFLEFIREIVSQLTIGPNKTQVALVTFNSKPFFNFNFAAYNTLQQLTQALQPTSVTYKPGSVAMGAAINYVIKNVFVPSAGARSNVHQALVLVTASYSVDNVKNAVSTLRASNIETFTVGVTDYADPVELTLIASTPADSHVFIGVDYSVLPQIVTSMSLNDSSTICSEFIGWCLFCNI